MESVDYCPMGSPVLDKTTHLGVTRSRYSLRRGLVERILLLTGLYYTLDRQVIALTLCSGQPGGELSGGKWIGAADPV